ncbi:hypothetical protein IFM89_005479, partial [Coptis chinensis]
PFLKELQHVPQKLNVSRTIKDTYSRTLDAFVDSVFQFVDQPYLAFQRNFAPVEEIGHVAVIGNIEGKIPTDFPTGVYLRNGPNPLYGGFKSTVSLFGNSSSSWIEGEGMLHALYFTKDTQDCWTMLYNNKYVKTESYMEEKRKNKPSFLPAIEGDSLAILAAFLLNWLRFGKANKHFSNTNVFEHSGKCYSIAENHMPHEVDIVTLETLVGGWVLEKSWGRPFTSHPKRAPGTGELVILGADAVKPFIVLGVVSADGKKLLSKVDLKFSRSIICHDVGVTEKYNIILDSPLTADINRLIKGGSLFMYRKEDHARMGVMPRYGDGNSVVVRGCRAQGSVIPGPDFGHNKDEWFSRGLKPLYQYDENASSNLEVGELFARVYEWRLNMLSGEVKETSLTGTSFGMDLPMINEKYNGIRNKFGYAHVADPTASSSAGLKYGMLAKLYFEELLSRPTETKEHFGSEEIVKVEYHKLEENNFCTGAAFVSKLGGRDEDDGWIVCFVHNEETDVSQVHIIDTKNFEGEPVVKLTLPQRVPYGFHGTYVSRSIQPQEVLYC